MSWKAYEEVHFSDDNIQRWIREGDEYVNRMTLEQMSEFETKVRQQQAEIESLKLQNDNYWVMIEILRQKVKAQEK